MKNAGTKNKQMGFTLIEILVAMALGIVVLAVIFNTFTSQQDSYSLQSQVTMTQQNLRAALYMISRDIQMAGFYSNFVDSEYSSDWDDNPATNDNSIRPLIYHINDADKNFFPDMTIKDKTDILVIVKASAKHRELVPGESGTFGGLVLTNWEKNGISRNPKDLDGDGDDDLFYYNGAGHSKYGLLVKKDLSRAEIFEVGTGDNFIFNSGLIETYGEGDEIFKLDVIMYLIDNSDPAHPTLSRRNIGTDNSFTEIAEDIDNLQFEFLLNDGAIVNNLADDMKRIPLVRAVKTYLIARSEHEIRGHTDRNDYDMGTAGSYKPADKYLRRLLSATIKTRNLGQ